MNYDTIEQAEMRLAGTIVGYDGVPVTVDTITGRAPNFTITFRPFPYKRGSERTAPLDDPAWNRFRTLPLGFINFFRKGGGFDCSFAERTSGRQNKQGLADGNFSCSTLIGGQRWTLNTVANTEAFREMVAGEYPTFDTVVAMLSPASSIAVSREFALRMDEGGLITLFYKRTPVGLVFRSQLFLKPDYQYLLEMVIEEPNLPAMVEVL